MNKNKVLPQVTEQLDMKPSRVNPARIHIIYPGGAGGNFMMQMLADMFNIPMQHEVTEKNEYRSRNNRFMSHNHLWLDWKNHPQLSQKEWGEFLLYGVRHKSTFIVINSRDPYYTISLGAIKNGEWEGKTLPDRTDDYHAHKWRKQSRRSYLWVRDEFREWQIPHVYLEYHDLFYDAVEESLQRICTQVGIQVDNLDKYVKMINEYTAKNDELIKRYKSDIYFSRYG